MNANKYQGNFVIVFNNDEHSLDFLRKIPENLYAIKDKKQNLLRIASYEPQAPRLEYEITEERVLKVSIGGHNFCDMSLDCVHAICKAEGGQILWKKSG